VGRRENSRAEHDAATRIGNARLAIEPGVNALARPCRDQGGELAPHFLDSSFVTHGVSNDVLAHQKLARHRVVQKLFVLIANRHFLSERAVG